MSFLKSLSINTSDYYDEGDYRQNLFRYRSRLRYEHDTQITVLSNDINVTSSKCLSIETKCISGMNCQSRITRTGSFDQYARIDVLQ